jgi:NADH:ubiquinone reductase (H+-translocating)
VFQFSSRSDVANKHYLGGRPGAKIKELVCRSTVWQLAYEARKPGVRTWWSKDDKRQQLLAGERGEALASH